MTLKEKLEFFKSKGYTYDPESGSCYNSIGKLLTTTDDRGYNVLVNSKDYKTIKVRSHQFGWFIVNNEIPTEIDHIDRNKSNNKISNLRNISHQKIVLIDIIKVIH